MLGKPLSVCVLALLEALQSKVSISKSGLVCLGSRCSKLAPGT